MPYRSTREKHARAKPEGGLVEEVVQQFADRYAFARELVQNSIDAGATSVRVEVLEGELLSFCFADDGAGMTFDVVQGPLLTVFSSTKEGDRSKIGKYGIGFKSVLALDPVEVVVETWRREGAYRVRLLRDHSFEIEELEHRAGSGTTVTLHLLDDGRPSKQHVSDLHKALDRWCRYVRCPLFLSVAGAVTQLNVPLDVAAPVVVRREEDGILVVIGPASTERTAEASAGFYCHGLTLLEVAGRPPAIEGLSYKVDSPDLKCTVSRDDVRRDGAFERAMKLVMHVAAGPMLAAIDDAMAQAADAFAADGSSFARYAALLAASLRHRPVKRSVVGLVEPFDQKRVVDVGRLDDLWKRGRIAGAMERSALTTLAAERGLVVLRVETFDPADSKLGSLLGRGLASLDAQFGAVVEKPSPAAISAAAELAPVLTRTGRRVSSVVPVELVQGVWGRASAFVEDKADGQARAWLMPSDRSADGRRLLVRCDLLEAASEAPDRARAIALLARMILVDDGGATSASANDSLLASALPGAE